MMFNKKKGKVWHWGRITPCTNTSWCTAAWKATSQKQAGVNIDNNLNMSQKCALAAKLTNSHWGCSKESFGSSLKEIILPLYSDVVRFLQCQVQFYATYYERDMDIPGQVQSRAIKMIKGLKHLTYKGKLRELGLLSLENRKHKARILSMHINT